eukprot:GHRR01037106.1.p1 GENE.GHRR01037106.1~~GHRR01037106.1.p1  ORF type:complete len:396 (+),score=131.32 GHRR01037106.1:463-1650(+)
MQTVCTSTRHQHVSMLPACWQCYPTLSNASFPSGLFGSSSTATAAHAAAAKAAAAEAVAAATGGRSACHAEPGVEHAGEDVIEWGTQHLKDSAKACCVACQQAQQRGCNVWVWCGESTGCGKHKWRECWLKRQHNMQLTHIAGTKETNWTSGALFSDIERNALVVAEQARLQALRNAEELPLVYFDVAIKGKPIGRIHFVLLIKESPRAAENFRQLCTGEKGIVPPGRTGAGQAYHFKEKPFYRIIHQFINQAGANTESVFGGQFKDDSGGLKLKHDRKGLLSMANTGPDTNDSHFSIMLAAAPHLDGHYTILGEAVDGFEVIDAINALSHNKADKTATAEDGAIIADSGQIRQAIRACPSKAVSSGFDQLAFGHVCTCGTMAWPMARDQGWAWQ